MRRLIVILALASLCAAESPSRAEQASEPRGHQASVPRAHREKASSGVRRRARAAAPVRVKAQAPARKMLRLLDPRIALRAWLVFPSAAMATNDLITPDLSWTRGEWDMRPVAATTSGFVPALSTDDWRLLLAAGLSGFALVSPIAPAMGFPGLRTHQRPPAGLLCLDSNRLDVCMPAISAVKDPYYDSRWAGLSVRVFEARF